MRSKLTPETNARRLAALDAFARDTAPRGYDQLIAAAKADGVSWPQDAAQAIIREINAEHARAVSADGAGFPDLEAVERQASADWDGSPIIRAEFGAREAYLAFRKADAMGKVRLIGRARIR